ncbi:MAG: tRNA (adenosine(37)-N6)-threonylcarbamoyltransferase complex ATPase subunit type 1 TsaE [Pseudomonadota bacterium]
MQEKKLTIDNEQQTLNLGQALAKHLPEQFVIYLHGDLGVGKTTLVRGILSGLGFHEKVKSPTYTFVEPYTIDNRQVFHFDLYRLHNALELEDIGVRDYFTGNALILIEWPEVAAQILPNPDLHCYIEIKNQQRIFKLQANTRAGTMLLKQLI